ncbi:MAG: hypothetical protein QXV16_01720 [Candidatus Anstonellales archaeon]
MRPLYRLEFIYLINELKIVEGQILDNAYRYGDIYRIKFRTHSINIQIPLRINIAYLHYPSESPDRIVQLLKKYSGSKLNRIDLVDMDRLVKLEFDRFSMYLEFFGKGNLIIEGDDGRFYTNYPNLGKTKPLDQIKYDGNVDRYISTVFGKIYVDYLRNRMTGDPLADLDSIRSELAPYYKDREFRVLPQEGYNRANSLSQLIENYYEKKIEITSDRYEKLIASKEKLLRDIEETEIRAREYQKIGELILQNYERVEEEIIKNRGKGKIQIEL